MSGMPCERVLARSALRWSCASWMDRPRCSGTEFERVTWSDGSDDDRSLGPTRDLRRFQRPDATELALYDPPLFSTVTLPAIGATLAASWRR
jgi:hypothetical protein